MGKLSGESGVSVPCGTRVSKLGGSLLIGEWIDDGVGERVASGLPRAGVGVIVPTDPGKVGSGVALPSPSIPTVAIEVGVDVGVSEKLAPTSV